MSFRLLWFVATTALCASVTSGARLTDLHALLEATEDSRPRSEEFTVVAMITHEPNGICDEFSIQQGNEHMMMTDGCFWPDLPLRCGDIIRASGSVVRQNDDTYNYARAKEITILSHQPLPPPEEADATRIRNGEFRNRTFKLSGTVIDIFRDEIDPRYVFLTLFTHEGCIYVSSHYTNDLASTSHLKGAQISLTGSCRKLHVNESRSNLGFDISTSIPDDIHVLKPAPTNIFDMPPLHDGMFGLASAQAEELPWRKVTGTVIAVRRRNQVFIRTASGKTSKVLLTDDLPPSCGTVIEAVGMPETDFHNRNLSRASWQTTIGQPITLPPPSNVTARFLLTDAEGRRAIKNRFHGARVRLSGMVQHVSLTDEANGILVLRSDAYDIPVEFSLDKGLPNAIQPGCKIEVTGICILETENWQQQHPFPRIEGVTILVCQDNDIRLLENPPWWTTKRLCILVGILVLTCLTIVAWNVLLQRLSAQKGQELARLALANSESKLKVHERTRLATELHDTIVQNLTGASLHLRTADKLCSSDPAAMREQMSIAQKTIDSCRDEIRNCIWDLRSRALDEPYMDDAIRRTLAPHAGDVKLSVRFAVPRNRLTDNTAHGIICIIRELVLNAIRHGKATSIQVAGCLDGNQLLFSVKDNGMGFDANKAPGIEQGHFGLQGIRERIGQLQGDVTITSLPGEGTKVSVRIRMPKEGKQ